MASMDYREYTYFTVVNTVDNSKRMHKKFANIWSIVFGHYRARGGKTL